jgi:AbiTii
MKLISEVIEILSSENPNLTNALIKTKVLLHRLGQKDLIGWVNSELNGYKDDDDLPPYRILPAQVLVNASNMAYQVTSHPIPLAHLDKKRRESLETAKFQQSIGVPEELADSHGSSIQSPIPMEWIPTLNKGLANNFQIQTAWCEIGKTSLTQALVEVRSRLLDFMLELSKEFGGEMTDEELKNKSQSVDSASMFNSAMFGDNTTIVVGDANRVQISTRISKGNFTELEADLKKHDVSEADIKKLHAAVASDEGCEDHKKNQFGPAVKKWTTEMLGKAVDTTWQIGIGAAGNLLANALQAFYGWH